jgi:hypothetical protein
MSDLIVYKKLKQCIYTLEAKLIELKHDPPVWYFNKHVAPGWKLDHDIYIKEKALIRLEKRLSKLIGKIPATL